MIRSLRSDPVNARIGSSRQTAASGRDGSGTPIGVPLPERVADALRDDILKGRFSPGEALRETAIAEEFEVSRAPVREALRILAAEGLVESLPYRHTRVRRITSTESRRSNTCAAARGLRRGAPSSRRHPLRWTSRSVSAGPARQMRRTWSERRTWRSVPPRTRYFQQGDDRRLTGHARPCSGVWDMVTIRKCASIHRHAQPPTTPHPWSWLTTTSPIVDAHRPPRHRRGALPQSPATVRSAADLIVLMDEDATGGTAPAPAQRTILKPEGTMRRQFIGASLAEAPPARAPALVEGAEVAANRGARRRESAEEGPPQLTPCPHDPPYEWEGRMLRACNAVERRRPSRTPTVTHAPH